LGVILMERVDKKQEGFCIMAVEDYSKEDAS
jgi:hypothetical protein